MGQYYKPVILDGDNQIAAWAYSHDFDNGLKLMEHSYVGNKFVSAVESMLTPHSPYYKSRVVWGGDYAEVEEGMEQNLYGLCQDNQKQTPNDLGDVDSNEYPYVVNHTKKEYVDKRLMPTFYEDWQIHPLPLLTCEGNGQGGGDYHPNPGDEKFIGTWARDVISVEKTLNGLDNFIEIKPRFIEDY